MLASDERAIHAVVLAAGQASRFGANKLLAHLDDKPLMYRSLRAAQDACRGRVWLVVGNEADRIAAAANELADHVIINRQYSDGIGTSIACGVDAARTGADGILILLADQPSVSGADLSRIIDNWALGNGDIVAAGFADTFGPPALFGRAYFEALTGLQGDIGAKQIIRANMQSTKLVAVQSASADVDTPEDLARLAVTQTGSSSEQQ